MDAVNLKECSPEELLGPLNEVERKHAPATFHVAGKVELLRQRPRISVVGSRSATAAGLSLARDVAAAIVSRRGVVVSGLAKGVDTVAHRYSLENRGWTVAVLGTPLTEAYPYENEELQRTLMSRQLVVSEFPPGKPTTRKDFVLRNRTMALISHGTVIVEASESSGTQHQGWEALRLGRTLFLPEELVRAPFDWPGKMVGYGAVTFRDAEDLGTFLDELLPSPPPRSQESIEIRF